MRLMLLLLLLLFPQVCYQQGINNLWLFGNANPSGPPWGGGVMNFSQGYLNAYAQSRILNINCTNASICDSAGNFLFASNGAFIQNAANDTMVNGSGLNPGVFANFYISDGLTIPQANLIIPVPNNPLNYYLFHETFDDYPFDYNTLNLFYSIIDMSLQGGLGEVVQKNIVLLNDSLVPGRLTACKHANGRDWWLIAHRLNNNMYYKFLITPSGIQGPDTQHVGSMRRGFYGQCVFSPDGRLFAYYEPHQGDLDVFEFDRCTGDFTMKENVAINDSAFGGGVAFSANSKVLYVSSMNYVYQFDMNAASIASSQFTVAVWDGFMSYDVPQATVFYLSHLAPDGKIYINCSNSTHHIHVINQPDSLGHASALCQHCIHLPVQNAFTMPNHPNYFLGAEQGTVCDSLSLGVNEGEKNIAFSISPNPVISRELTLNYGIQPKERKVVFYDIHGRMIMQRTLPAWTSVQQVLLPELSPGIYLAKTEKTSVKFLVGR